MPFNTLSLEQTESHPVSTEHADINQIVRGLLRQFDEKKHRIVFWHDADQEFGDALPALELNDITLLRLDEMPALKVKIQLERDDTTGRYLLYMPFDEPPLEHDWLLDMRLYSGAFRADRASLQLAELGLGQHQALRDHLKKRAVFLKSKDRLTRLGRLVRENDTEADIDRKMLAVLLRSEQTDVFALTAALFHDLAAGGGTLDAVPAVWSDIEKFGLTTPFWTLIAQHFG